VADPGDIAQIVLYTLGAEAVLKAPAQAVSAELAARIRPRFAAVLDKFSRKTGGARPSVSDRVASKVLNEAAFTDDDVTLEYLAGVLAASGPDDDTGAAIVAQIGRLSALQLRFHYIVYRELRRLWPPGAPLNMYQQPQTDKAGIRIPVQDLVAVIGAGVGAMGSIVPPLIREDLLSSTRYDFGKDGNTYSARVRPTGAGAELFLWGLGARSTNANRLVEPTFELDLLDVPDTPHTSLLDTPKPQRPSDDKPREAS
jgi:hypothetical protein